MFRVSWFGKGAALAVLCAVAVAGCVVPGDVGSGLLVAPGKLNFGEDTEVLHLRLSRNVSTSRLGPIVLHSNVDWITIGACTDVAEGCGSFGPIDQIIIPVRVDRSKTRLGTNRAVIFAEGSGASRQEIAVEASDRLQTDFDASNRSPEIGRPITFNDRSATNLAGGITSWAWDFGDGNTSMLRNPIHQYQRAGLYDVSLTITTAKRTETRVKSSYVTVGAQASGVNFAADTTNIFERDSVAFTDTSVSRTAPIVAWAWDFGDGGTSTEQSPIHRYDNPGVYDVSLTVTTAFAGETVATETETKRNFIVVQRRVAPRANFAIGQLSPFVNVPVQFTDLSVAGTAPITSWIWEFGDGTISRVAAPLHTYGRIGDFEVKLTVASAHGVSTKALAITVDFQPPTADFVAAETNPSTNTPVQFQDRSIPGSGAIVSWAWTFGDGGTSASRNPVHTYTAAGTYTVSLTVTTTTESNNTATLERVGYIRVFDPPAPAFSFAPRSAFTTDDVRFTNQTVAGTETELTYLWDFDGNPATTNDQTVVVNPVRRFSAPGVYNVTLTAFTPTRSVTSEPNPVTVDRAPTPEFTVSTTNPTSVTTVQFTDTTNTDNTRPVIGWLWNFGDGTTSNDQNPLKRYDEVGRYDVSLTIRYTHSETGVEFQRTLSRGNYINVVNPVPPTANFSVDNPCALPGVDVQFTDASTRGSGAIDGWFWNFGDGTTSTERNPVKRFDAPGTYEVTLTAETSEIEAPFNEGSVTIAITVANSSPTALDEYVRAPDAAYSFNELGSFRVTAGSFSLPATAYTLYMTSQTWRNSVEIYSPGQRAWTHNVTIIAPDAQYRRTDTALLYIDGGSRGRAPFTASTLPEALAQFALATGSVIAAVDNVPSQPITFGDEEGLRSRSEDAIIAYSFDQFLNGFVDGDADPTWPVLLPMVKAAVRAMDTVQDYLPTKGVAPIEDFVVLGGSKRGWTTWLTGATDCRVRAIAPVVIDVLNMDQQMEHHRNAYGFWAPAIYDYAQMRVFDRLLPDGGGVLPEAQALLEIVDPYEYRERMTMPKLLLNSTGDEFFVPDSAQWYFADLLGEKHLSYVPNTSHGIADLDQGASDDPALNSLLAWYMALTQNIARPNFTWTVDRAAGRVVVTPDGTTPKQVRLWQATNTNTRDFRRQEGVVWTSTTLSAQPNGTYVGQVQSTAWTGFFIQVSYNNPATFAFSVPGFTVPDMVFTTEIGVTPDAYPDFTSFRDNSAGVPLVVLYGTPAEMGQAYGQLMQVEIAAQVANTLAGTAATNAQLDAAWTAQSAAMDPRIVAEINAIASGSGVNLTSLRRAHMVPVVERLYQGESAVAWRTATQSGGLMHTQVLNQSRARGLQNTPVVVFYVPSAGFGNPHAVATFAGMAYGWAGVNVGGISVSETDDPTGANNFAGGRLHHLPLLRETLYDSLSLREAIAFPNALRPTKADTLFLADGRNENRGAKLVTTPNDAPFVVLANQASDPLAPLVLRDVVYGGTRNSTAFPFLSANLGNLNLGLVSDAASLRNFNSTVALSGNNVLNVMMDARNFVLYIAYGTSSLDARGVPYSTINLQNLLP